MSVARETGHESAADALEDAVDHLVVGLDPLLALLVHPRQRFGAARIEIRDRLLRDGITDDVEDLVRLLQPRDRLDRHVPDGADAGADDHERAAACLAGGLTLPLRRPGSRCRLQRVGHPDVRGRRHPRIPPGWKIGWICGNTCGKNWGCTSGLICSGWICGNTCGKTCGKICGCTCSGWICGNTCGKTCGKICGCTCSGWICGKICGNCSGWIWSGWSCGKICGCTWICSGWICGKICGCTCSG